MRNRQYDLCLQYPHMMQHLQVDCCIYSGWRLNVYKEEDRIILSYNFKEWMNHFNPMLIFWEWRALSGDASVITALQLWLLVGWFSMILMILFRLFCSWLPICTVRESYWHLLKPVFPNRTGGNDFHRTVKTIWCHIIAHSTGGLEIVQESWERLLQVVERIFV